MAKKTPYTHVDICFRGNKKQGYAQRLVDTYDGRVLEIYQTFVCAQIPTSRVSHLKSTATKKKLTVKIDIF